jgi:hypothetical protein
MSVRGAMKGHGWAVRQPHREADERVAEQPEHDRLPDCIRSSPRRERG